ncbi:MAG: hypothetical protein ACI4JS_03070, partial [Oscillospiraceae bacterium]
EMDKGNKYIHLKFKYGGNNFNLDWLNPYDIIWLTQLFFAHGWHLLNKAALSHRDKTRNIEQEFIDKFLCKNGTYTVDGVECLNQKGEPHLIRLPLALVYELYKEYARKEKPTSPISNTQFRELLTDKYSFSYSTQKATKIDIDYISNKIKGNMGELGIYFDEKWAKADNSKIVNCTVKDEFWDVLHSLPSDCKDDDTRFDSFDKFIKDLYSRYQGMFIYRNLPNNPNSSYEFGSQLI